VKIGAFSRQGVARGRQPVAAADHDRHPDAVLAPAGILEVDSGQLSVVFGTSRDTSDFVADCLELWWNERQAAHPNVKKLLINLDNGPEIGSSRTQFMKRQVEFSDRHHLTLELAYYPPYHSQYNRIERCWGVLENHWNGALLSTAETALRWARTMTWRGVAPLVRLLDQIYDTGVRLTKRWFQPIANRLLRSPRFPNGASPSCRNFGRLIRTDCPMSTCHPHIASVMVAHDHTLRSTSSGGYRAPFACIFPHQR